jgi:transposase
MTRPLSNDLRHRVISAVNGGMTRRAATKMEPMTAPMAIRTRLPLVI